MMGPQDLPGRPRWPEVETKPPAKPAEPAAEPTPRSWLGCQAYSGWDRATGDWAGARTWLIEHGVTIEASLTTHWSGVWSGGLANRASTRHVFDLNATLDSQKLLGYEGGTLYLDAYAATNRGGSRDVGDFQGISNIDTGRNLAELAEVWYQQVMADGALRVKVGKIDANSEFAYVNAAGDFMSSSTGVSPTVVGIPTYPNPAMGVVVFGKIGARGYLGGGVFDGATMDGFATGTRGPDQFFSDSESASWFMIAEAGLTWDSVGGLGAGRAYLGVRHHSAQFAKFEGGTRGGSTGLYGAVEQQVWAPKPEDACRGLFCFCQGGCGDGDTDAVELHAAAGVVLKGTFSGRDDDTTGAYVSFVDLSDATGSPFESDETSIEVYYKIHLTPFVNITPDLQYIIDPGGASGVNDALVGQLRVEVLF